MPGRFLDAGAIGYDGRMSLYRHFLAAFAAPPGSLADPAGSGSILAAVAWLEGTLLGTVASAVAVIAVASVGLMMLTGRTSLRRGASVILGCFILFGASSIAAGIRNVAQAGSAASAYAPQPDPPPLPPAPPPVAPAPYDPYAGAAVPSR